LVVNGIESKGLSNNCGVVVDVETRRRIAE